MKRRQAPVYLKAVPRGDDWHRRKARSYLRRASREFKEANRTRTLLYGVKYGDELGQVRAGFLIPEAPCHDDGEG